MLQKYFLIVTLFYMNGIFVFSYHQIRTFYGKWIPSLDDLYITSQLLDSTATGSKYQCITTCIDHVDCRAASFHLTIGRCLRYHRDFKNQTFESRAEIGGRHYQIEADNRNVHIITTASDCSEVQSQGYFGNGVYTINPSGSLPVDVYCDLTTDGGHWTVIQRRFDGSVDFFVYWADYKIGFGPPTSEHWIGNDALHQLTQSGNNELLILMEDWDGIWKHARFSDFRITNEADNYRLHVSSAGYTGTAGINSWERICYIELTILTVNNPEFLKHAKKIYPKELQLNKANSDNKCCAFLDLTLKIHNGKLYTKIYDKRNDFDFPITNFPFLDGDVPLAPSYGVYISQLVRFAFKDFNEPNLTIFKKLLQQGYRFHNIIITFGKFLKRYKELIEKYGVTCKQLVVDGISHPSFYCNVVNKLS